MIVTSLLGVLTTSHVAASGFQETSRTQSVSPPCGLKVYMTASGASTQDATNDADVKTSLETNTDLCITIGVNFYDLETVAQNVILTNYDVIYLQGQNNWYGSDLTAFGDADFDVIEAFLASGGGMVVGEWHAWNECTRRSTSSWMDLAAIMPVTIRGNCLYGSGQKVRFYRWERPLSSQIDTGVGADFVFEPADFAGSLSFLNLKSGATPYYWATWDTDVNNIPAASDPAASGFPGGVGMAGWVPTNYTGRVFSFSTTNGAPELADTTPANSFRRLLLNALGWAGSVGGSITPDAVAISAQVGTSLSTPELVSSRMTGTITYSIISGALPPGLVLNTSTGQITGTPAQGGDIDVTIQATGTSGQAVALIKLNIAGGTTPNTPSTPSNNTPSTPSEGASSDQSSSEVVTNVATLISARLLPSTGSSSTPQILMALFILAGGVLLYRKARRV